MDILEENTVYNNKKSHKEWRKEAKKFRRKKFRQKIAILRENEEKILEEKLLKDPAHLTALAEKLSLELMEEEECERQRIEDERKFEEAEKRVQEECERKQKILEEKQEKLELEQKKKRELLEKHRKIVEVKDTRRELILTQIHEYTQGTGELPEELKNPILTNPDQELCQFFRKTGCCRFSDKCLRNHVRPSVSKTILIPKFFELNYKDHNRRSNAEFVSSQTYQEFVEFYNDVLPEFEKIGEVVQFRVCYNHLPHLKGNVFVEFRDQRKAVEAFQLMYGRYYGGRKIYSEFATIDSWKAAVCGLALSNKCHVGKACNFLHVFRNPKNRFPIIDDRMTSARKLQSSVRSVRTNGWHKDPGSIRANWRWSETSEPTRSSRRRESPRRTYSKRSNARSSISSKRKRSRSDSRSRKSSKSHHKSRSRNRSWSRRKSRSRERSKSREKTKSGDKSKNRSRNDSKERYISKSRKRSRTKSKSRSRRKSITKNRSQSKKRSQNTPNTKGKSRSRSKKSRSKLRRHRSRSSSNSSSKNSPKHYKKRDSRKSRSISSRESEKCKTSPIKARKAKRNNSRRSRSRNRSKSRSRRKKAERPRSRT